MLNELGTEFDLKVGREFVDVSLRVLNEDVAKAVNLLCECVFEPALLENQI